MKYTSKLKSGLITLGLLVLALTGCSSGGSCNGCSSGGGATPQSLTLLLTAPDQYPAGVEVEAYLTLTNTSQVNATNLVYSIPAEYNQTGAIITVSNDRSVNPCIDIAAGQSCTFVANIAATPPSHPGSFRVDATSTNSSSLFSRIKSSVGKKAQTLSLTANIGLTTLPTNTNSGANGINFLYSQTIAAAESTATQITIVAVVNSAKAGAFNTINLTDASGNLLSFKVLSGNSGSGLTNLTKASIVTFLLEIPPGTSNYNFYAQTMNNGSVVNLGTIANPINLANSNQGILVVQPTNFNLSATESYTSQIITYTNIGNATLNGLSIATPSGPFALVNNNCGASLAAGASCLVTVQSNAPIGASGSSSLVATYSQDQTTVAQFNYAGVDAQVGVQLSSANNFAFSANTFSSSESTQVTLTNSGNVAESNFVFSFSPDAYFTLSNGTTATPCVVTGGSTVAASLAAGASCTLTVAYTNSSISGGNTDLNVSYSYSGQTIAAPAQTMSYSTVRAAGVLQVTSPLPLPYTFSSIIADNHESQTQVFVIANVGNGTASNINSGGLQGPVNPTFTIINSTPASSQCASGKSSLAPGETCLMTVRFGPVALQEGLKTKNMILNYESYASAGTSLSVPMQGTVIEPLAANPNISSITLSPAATAGDGSSTTPFQIKASTPTTVTVTYTNSGAYAASSFTVDTNALTGYSVQTNKCQNISLAINGTCTVTLGLSASSAGNPDLLVSNLIMSWSDQRGSPINGVPSTWNSGQTTAYVTVYPVPTVAVVLSSSPTGSPVISGGIGESADFYVVYTLTGGYNESMTYGVTLNGTPGSPAMSVASPTTCTVTSAQPSCSIKISSGGLATNQSISYTTQGGAVTPSPTTSSTFDVALYIFITASDYNGDLQHGGGVLSLSESSGPSGADAICQSEAYATNGLIPANLVFKGLIISSTRSPCNSKGDCGAAGASSDWAVVPNHGYITPSIAGVVVSSDVNEIFESTYTQNLIRTATGATAGSYFWIGATGVRTGSTVSQLTGWANSDLNGIWTGGSWTNYASMSCSDWGSNDGSTYGSYGDNGALADDIYTTTPLNPDSGYSLYVAYARGNGKSLSRWITQGGFACSDAHRLICVQAR